MKKFLLAIVSMSAAVFAHAQCTDLFISEYDEGTSNSKALEIYNPTSDSINLSNYRLVRYSNGSSVGVDSIPLGPGYIHAHDVWVVANGQVTPDGNGAFCDPALVAIADQLGPAPYVTGTAVMFFNGDDAIVLAKISPYAELDIFGKIGQQPATAWSDAFPYDGTAGAWWTKDKDLIRKSTVTGGVTSNPATFIVTTEWDSMPKNTWTNLGMHTSTCNTSGILENGNASNLISVYPNPANGVVTVSCSSPIQTITVVNILGEVVVTNSFGNHNNVAEQKIDLGELPAGIYFLRAELTSGSVCAEPISVK
jgi:hypothetical protein